MRHDHHAFLEDCVITAMCDDYESFEHIFEEVRSLAKVRGVDVEHAEVAEILERVIAQGLADAYELSPQERHGKKVQFSSRRLHELWFYVTPLGKKNAKGIPKLSGENY